MVSIRAQTVFVAGAGCFVVAFLSGTSFDYRLMFLLLLLPAAIELGESERTSAHSAGVILISAIIGTLWLSRMWDATILDEALNWWLVFTSVRLAVQVIHRGLTAGHTRLPGSATQ